mmetsp:Transcript_26165/g.73199  ORF Transcript_26165/g.73199 Transcript_26165/m.73199 type:complete len:192 (+) Transcript_26165:64-639(+)
MAARAVRSRRSSRALFAAAACACVWLLASTAFVAGPQVEPAPIPVGAKFHPAVAASAALPALTLLADSAEATYGVEVRRWNIILMPLVTLVVPAIAFGSFVLYSFEDDAFWQLLPGSRKSKEVQKAWREHRLFANIKDPMDGLIDRDDFERGLEEAWEKAKPAGSTVTVKGKLEELSTQNAPHSLVTKMSA